MNARPFTHPDLERAGILTRYLDHARTDEINEHYHASPGVSASGLKSLITTNPEKFAYSREHPSDPTPAMRLGTAFHSRMEDCVAFAHRYAVAPKVDRRTKAGKATWQAFTEETEGKTILTEEEYIHVIGMADAISAHVTASNLAKNLFREHSIRWRDEKTRELCRCRPDAWFMSSDGDVVAVDYKTTDDASPEAFSRSCLKYGYDIQAAFYSDGLRQATGLEVAAFIFVAVEKSPPYSVAVYAADDAMLEYGTQRYRDALDLYASRKAENHWPGYPDKLQMISLPAWATKSLNHWEA